ncbi:MAG: glutamine-hydrolyzing carbamoyl-phosphate synthase small subunit [Planctomycetes bacterium]|nr:glutamine-hydrolyzing carbamoyl-phosphate synthase small subunit [Planctomycetota bacterium]NUQ34382.1 glutamine-hydrolyzing carbamoyl-phosphate synthase small subunit [Planctomycetaceae bacterium]
MREGKLILEDGFTVDGELFGAVRDFSTGEVVFNTALTGYQEIITDPSYAGQMVVMTYPLIGNYGVTPEDNERERVHMRGLIVRELSSITSNCRASGPLDEMLRASNVPGIAGVDTRAITRHIRETGAMKGAIVPASADTTKVIEAVRTDPGLVGVDFVKQATLAEASGWTEGYVSDFADSWHLTGSGKQRYRCAAIDYGAKANILRCLVQAGFDVKVFPATATAKQILADDPECVFLSNGPGDPAVLDYAIDTVKGILKARVPLFGICLGHQLLTHALGGTTYKLKFGHHGANHPVKDLTTGRVEITSQNHGYATDPKALNDNMEITHINLNDDVISGIRWTKGPAYSVQFHPEASPGPHDSLHLFRRFHDMVERELAAK